MKALRPHVKRPASPWLGRSFSVLGTTALLVTGWLGWSSAGAQSALEGLWALCSVR